MLLLSNICIMRYIYILIVYYYTNIEIRVFVAHLRAWRSEGQEVTGLAHQAAMVKTDATHSR